MIEPAGSFQPRSLRRSPAGRVEGHGMLRRQAFDAFRVTRAGPAFERHMLRVSVDELAEERARCSDCGRTPLIGEDVHVYERGEIVCELCRQLRPQPPVSIERVRHSEFGLAVRLTRTG